MIQGKRRLIYAANELSKREVHILGLVAKFGMTGREIATELEVSHKTVRTHTYHILKKLNSRCLAQAVFKQFIRKADKETT